MAADWVVANRDWITDGVRSIDINGVINEMHEWAHMIGAIIGDLGGWRLAIAGAAVMMSGPLLSAVVAGDLHAAHDQRGFR